MKLSRKFLNVLLVVIVFAAFAVVPVFAQDVCDPLTDPTCLPSTEPTIPLTVDQFPWVSVLLVGLVTFVVTAGVKSISETFGIDITGKATAITGAVVLTVIELINGLLAAIPPEAIPSVTAGLGFIATLLSAFGMAGLFKKIKAKPETGK